MQTVIDYRKKEFYTELSIISNSENATLYYNKYNLCICSDYFKKMFTFPLENGTSPEANNSIKLDLEDKTIIMFLYWLDNKEFKINNIYLENLIELWDFSHEIMNKRLCDYICLFIIENFIKVIEHHDIGLIYIKSLLYIEGANKTKIKDLCCGKIDSFINSPEIQNLTPKDIGYLSSSWDVFVKILPVWTPFNNNINKISETGLDCSKLPKWYMPYLKNIVASTNDTVFLRQFSIAAIDGTVKSF